MANNNPYRIDGPAVISFSGGRSSGYMVTQIVRAHGGTLPPDVVTAFANTGKEMPETLDFVRDLGDYLNVPITWLEYASHDEPMKRWKIVSYETAARNGEPFTALLRDKGFLPNPVARLCTINLKRKPILHWAREVLGTRDYDTVIGYRADEPRRFSGLGPQKDGDDKIAPMATAGVTKRDVEAFWKSQNWDLRLPNINGSNPMGNCDLCFLKGWKTIMGLIRLNPSLADWWIEVETDARTRKPNGATFRKDRPTYAQMKQMVLDQTDIDGVPDDEAFSCTVCDIEEAAA